MKVGPETKNQEREMETTMRERFALFISPTATAFSRESPCLVCSVCWSEARLICEGIIQRKERKERESWKDVKLCFWDEMLVSL